MTDEEYSVFLLRYGIPIELPGDDKAVKVAMEAVCRETKNKMLKTAVALGRFYSRGVSFVVLPDIKVVNVFARALRELDDVAAAEIADEAETVLESITSERIDGYERVYMPVAVYKKVQVSGGWPDPKPDDKKKVIEYDGDLYLPGLVVDSATTAARVVLKRSWKGKVYEGRGSWRTGGVRVIGGKTYVIEKVVDLIKSGSELDTRLTT